jgi:hypothetical protein
MYAEHMVGPSWRSDSKNNIYRVNNVVVAANDATVLALGSTTGKN